MKSLITSFYARHREGSAYLVSGVAVTVINWIAYTLLVTSGHMGVTAGNTAAWLIAVLAAFLLNKCYVFRSRVWRPGPLLREAAAFFGSRIFSGVVEIGMVPLLMILGVTGTLFGIQGFFAKLISQGVSMVLNYFLGKYAVFRRQS